MIAATKTIMVESQNDEQRTKKMLSNEPGTCFAIEGNIGAGKSTFLKMVKEYLEIQAVFEPHEQWQTVGGSENLLEKFYTDTQRWAYTFQSYAFITRVRTQEEHAKINIYPAQILERSVYSDRYCFAKNCFEQGLMTRLEWQLYQEWFSWLIDTYVTKPTGFIYLQTDPDICYNRLRKRDRHEESAVSLDYLTMLHNKHENWLIKKEGVDSCIADIPVLVLHCNNDFEKDTDEQHRHVQKIINFIAEHTGTTVTPTYKFNAFNLSTLDNEYK